MFSVIIPIFNEERILPELRSRLTAATARLDEPHEVIFIDDGSRDGSYGLMTAMNAEDPRIKVIRLSRNFGHQIAISAGLDEARGDAVVLMDGDLQDPPELLPEMIRLWREGFHVVYTVKRSRRENPFKRLAFRLFYRILHALSTIQIPMDAGNFSLMDRRVVEVLRTMPERNRYDAHRPSIKTAGAVSKFCRPFNFFKLPAEAGPEKATRPPDPGLALRAGYVTPILLIVFGQRWQSLGGGDAIALQKDDVLIAEIS